MQLVEQVGTNCKEKYFKFVGHVLDDRFTWVGHVEHICKKLASANFAINSTKNVLPLKIRKTLYYSMFDSHLNFGNLLWGCANKNLINKVENLQKRCIRNVGLKNFKLSDKLSYCRSIFMHQYKNNKLPTSFSDKFVDITCTDELQTRHNDYNFVNKPACKSYLEKFPYKQILSNWNSLNIDLKSTADGEIFKQMLKEMYPSKYSCESQCLGPCYSCSTK